ncbi:MAG: T9SS type A sorting domain-containing protein [Candidatus Marinimicrobia bacterium]|nr:T9SS type A sorting domain-containing protein [Candidatus Neomarinimicrobiota bacterium]
MAIKASHSVGSTGFEMISYDTGPDSWYWSSAGVASNKNQLDAAFGMVYVVERTGGTSGNDAGVETVRGLYMHYPDGRYFGNTQSVAYAAGNSAIDWDALGSSEGKPHDVSVGPDGRVYVSSLANSSDTPTTGGVAVGDAMWSTGSIDSVLKFFDLSNHNTISRNMVVGTGTDRVLYTVEQVGSRFGSDTEGPTDGDGFDVAEVRSYALGTSTGPFTGAYTVVIDSLTTPKAFGLAMDSDGFIYIVQAEIDTIAATNTTYGLLKFDISGSTPVEMWHIGLNDAPEHQFSTSPATASSFTGIALDEPNGRVYLARRNTDGRPLHNVVGYDMSTGAQLTGFSFSSAQSVVDTGTISLSGGGGNNIRGIAVDAAGNVLTVNSSSEALRSHSPPDGPNYFVTFSPTALDVGNSALITSPLSADALSSILATTERATVPLHYTLGQNYPNPFNGTTVIEYELPITSTISLTIYDLTGREVISLAANVRQQAGVHSLTWNGQTQSGVAAASGIYFYRLTARSSAAVTRPFNVVKRMVYLK